MKEQKKLEIQMFTLFLVVFIFFGIIIVTTKFEEIMIPKIEKRLHEYIGDKYKDIQKDLNIGKTKYYPSKSSYQIKISNKNIK